MTAAFEYEEPATIPMNPASAAESVADDPAAAALSMINNGPAPVDCNQEEETSPSLDETVTDTATIPDEGEPEESLEYGEEEYGELCRQADEDYELELQRLETEYAKAGVIIDQLSDELKGAKKRQKLIMEDLRELQADGPDYPEKTKPAAAPSNQGDGSTGAVNTPTAEQPGSLSPHSDVPYADADNLVATTPEHEEYYNTPTASLLAGIDGLGKAKLERLVEVAPTCRHLQQLNIQAGRYHHGDLSELLPQGFGKALGERIVNRLLDKMPFVKPS